MTDRPNTDFLKGQCESDRRFRVIAGDGLVHFAIEMDGETDRVVVTVSGDVAKRLATRIYSAGRQADGELPPSASVLN